MNSPREDFTVPSLVTVTGLQLLPSLPYAQQHTLANDSHRCSANMTNTCQSDIETSYVHAVWTSLLSVLPEFLTAIPSHVDWK